MSDEPYKQVVERVLSAGLRTMPVPTVPTLVLCEKCQTRNHSHHLLCWMCKTAMPHQQAQ